MRVEGLRVHPNLEEQAACEAGRLEPASAWAQGEPLSGGRGMTRRICLAGRDFFLKRESRGGLAGRLLPDYYLLREPFDREWDLSLWLGEKGLSPSLSARWYLGAGPAFQAWTLITPVEGAASLAELILDGKASSAKFERAGACVGRLHNLRVIHGDLNAGNLLLTERSCQIIDLRHSFLMENPPASPRYANLARLGRSLAKLSREGAAWDADVVRPLAKGYAQGFGEADARVEATLRGALAVSVPRRLAWDLLGR